MRKERGYDLGSGAGSFGKGLYIPKDPVITEGQFRALEKFVERSGDLTSFSKKILLWMLENTELLTRGVRVTFSIEHEELGSEAAGGFHSINSFSGMTHIGTFLQGMGLPYPEYRIFSRTNKYHILYISAGEDGKYEDLPFDLDAIESIDFLAFSSPQ
jgi:hypothetical protein